MSPRVPRDKVDFGPVIEFKMALLKRSFENFRAVGRPDIQAEFEIFLSG